MKFKTVLFTAIAMYTLHSGSAVAAVTGVVKVTQLRTGWDADQIAIETQEPYLNPAGCPAVDGYVSNASKPGHKEHYTAILTAMSTGMALRVVVSDTDCASGHPRIMGTFLVP